MKTKLVPFFFLLACMGLSKGFANKIIVDINGGGQYTTIQAGINAAISGDTVTVWPGTYNEQLNINKSIVVQGAGYESTIICGNYSPLVIIGNGVLKWFRITSLSGSGIQASGGLISNCVVANCAYDGICTTGNSSNVIVVRNCVVYQNNWDGMEGGVTTFVVYNCISKNNGHYDIANGNFSFTDYGSVTNTTGQGNITSSPNFTSSTDFRFLAGSPCIDAGNPALKDPDGIRSDMGYFGGPDAPIYPVVYEMTTTPNGSNINVQSKARANY